ncbi:hypothetical protein K3495_g532 [Podosphaera aphanis]|nr:hypothetical protein K3495_g532 [Podosphaera aphanis]
MAETLSRKTLLLVFGATGTGKSQLAIELAKRFNGEIINSDAMQMYAGLPIVTNKATIEEQQGIPHHLLGHIRLDQEAWRVGLFQREAERLIRQIRNRGRVPVVVGGTHYYTQSLLFPSSIMDETEDVTSELTIPLSTHVSAMQFPILNGPSEVMLEKLKEVDPVMAARWHPNDVRKIRRSLEICLTTGKRASEVYARRKQDAARSSSRSPGLRVTHDYLDLSSTLLFWTYVDPIILKERLDARVLKMMEAGLLDEIESMDQYLESQKQAGVHVDQTRGIWASIGWKEFAPYLHAKKNSAPSASALDLAIEQTQAATRQYAKRQLRWIKLNLRPALAQCSMLNDRLYLLDATNSTAFQDEVTNRAIAITADLLSGRELQAPQQLSTCAKEILGTVGEKPDVWFRQTCELCQMTLMNEIEWEAHLKSRRHRAALKKKNRNESVGTTFSHIVESL